MTGNDYATTGHRRVDGWLEDRAALLIYQLAEAQAAVGAVGEIGIHHGRLFILLSLLRRDGEKAVAIDLFEQQELNVDRSGRGNRAAFERNLDRFGAGRDVSIHAADSTTLTPEQLLKWGGGSYRLFSVDGGHTAEITESDLRLAAAVLAPGGLIVLDDYYNVPWPGVSEGTNRLLSGRSDLTAVGAGFNKMILARRENADMYRSVMIDVARQHAWDFSVQEFYGQPHISVWRPQPKGVLQRGKYLLRRSRTARRIVRAVKRRLR